MEFILFRFFALLSVAFVASHGALTPEDYWRSVLPNTPMPKSISELLQSPEWLDDKSKVYNLKVKSNKASGKPYVHAAATGIAFIYAASAAQLHDNHISAASTDQPTATGKPYVHAAAAAQLHDNPNVALFFLENDLYQGTNMNLHFTKPTTPTAFLPRKFAESIPFSSNKLPEIFEKFSVKQNTLESKTIKQTLGECEAPSIKGEEKYCATSLENMIDFSTSKLGKKVYAVSTVVEKESEMQRYRIVGSKKLGEKAVICHKQNYPYAVFYCHETNNVKAYTISLVGNDGTKAKAAAICHTDTSSWNPKHLAFQVLNVKPGSVPVCHFLPEDNVIWIQV